MSCTVLRLSNASTILLVLNWRIYRAIQYYSLKPQGFKVQGLLCHCSIAYIRDSGEHSENGIHQIKYSEIIQFVDTSYFDKLHLVSDVFKV